MITYFVTLEGAHLAQLRLCSTLLKQREEPCRLAVFDSPEEPIGQVPECDLYRKRSNPNGSWEVELGLLATVAHAFPEAAWIGKIDRLDAPPVLPKDRRGEVDCWICPNGYFVRNNLLALLLEDGASSPAPAGPIKETLAELVARAGGRVGRKEDGPPKQNYVAAPILSTHLPLSANAFCAVATGEAVLPEIELMVQTLRRHHSEPLVLVCDEPVAARIKELGLQRIQIEPVTEQLRAYAAKLSERVVSHDPYWKPEAIALKFHALRTAIRRHGPTHLLDADIVVNASLHTGGPWMADLVLSPFHWPKVSEPTAIAHGFFNAGYLLVRHSRIVDRWEQMYAEGLGGFYEQKCLENLGREFVTTWFGQDHNFAKWRWESPRRRPVTSFHHKLKARGNAPRIVEMSEAVRQALQTTKAPRKLAHVHCVRSWGTYFRWLIAHRVAPALGLQNLVSWDLGLNREWTEAELLLLAQGQLWGQHPGGCGFVHNHSFGWTEKALDAFHDHGWLTVALVRDPREVLLSLASWALDAMKRGQPCPVWHREGVDNSALAAAKSLEEAVAVLLNDTVYHPQWVLPPWLGKVKWLRRACPEAIEEFCRDLCGLPEVPRIGIRNESSSPGWEAAPLSADVRRLVDEHTEVRAWDEFLSRV